MIQLSHLILTFLLHLKEWERNGILLTLRWKKGTKSDKGYNIEWFFFWLIETIFQFFLFSLFLHSFLLICFYPFIFHSHRPKKKTEFIYFDKSSMKWKQYFADKDIYFKNPTAGKYACHSYQLNFYAKYPFIQISIPLSLFASHLRICVIGKNIKKKLFSFFLFLVFYIYMKWNCWMIYEIFHWNRDKSLLCSFWHCGNFPNDCLLNFFLSLSFFENHI